MTELFNSFAGSTPIQLIGQTLAHFLWQGAAVALALAGALRFTRSSAARYALACCAMAIAAACPVVNFTMLDARPGKSSVIISSAPPTISPTPQPGAVAPGTLQFSDFSMPMLVTAWLSGVAMLAVRNISGWRRLRTLRNDSIAIADDAWLLPLTRLIKLMRIDRSIRLASTLRFDSPATFGALRPIILVPASMLSGLPPAQIEAILAHELAHIRRHDYLVNLLQTAVETVLFYHLAVWWIGAVMRREREYCCDDIASAACGGDRRRYARALLLLEVSRDRSNGAMLAPAAAGGSVIDRARRLLTITRPPRRGALAGTIVAAAVAIAAVAMSFSATSSAVADEEQAVPATQPANEIVVNGQRYYIGGAVARPGVYELMAAGRVRISSAIKFAGGKLETATVQLIRTREGQEFLVKDIDIDELRAEPNGDLDVRIEPGDKVIVIPKSEAKFKRQNLTTRQWDPQFEDVDIDWRKTYRIGLFDLLHLDFSADVKFADDDPASGPTTRELRVNKDGKVLLGDFKIEVEVDGDTIDEAIGRITRKLVEKEINARIDLKIVDAPSKTVWIVGQVERPGEYVVAPGRKMRLSSLIVASGGLRENASKIEIHAARKQDNKVTAGEVISQHDAANFAKDAIPPFDPVIEIGQMVLVRGVETREAPATAPAR